MTYDSFEVQFAGFKGKSATKIGALSGGEKRLVELYLLLQGKSKFLILDEPFSQLTPVLVEQVKPLIEAAALTKGILVTDHLYKDIIDIADDINLLSHGNIRLVKDLKELEFFGYLKKAELNILLNYQK